MRLPFLRRQPRVEMMTPDETVDHLVRFSQSLSADIGATQARGVLDALLRDQRRSRQERQEWLAFLFDGHQAHPPPLFR